MPSYEAPTEELGTVPDNQSIVPSPSPSEVSTASSPEPHRVTPTPMFRALAMPPPEPEQPPGQEELERRLPGYRRIVIPRELTLIELLKQCSGVTTDEEVLQIREAKLKVIAERIGLRRLHILAPRLRSLTLDGSALSSLRDLGIGLQHLKILSVNRCGLTSLDGVWGLGKLRELHASGNKLQDLHPLAALQKLNTLNLSDNPISESSRLWTIGICSSLKRLSLKGAPVADSPDYRARVASALPMLVYLDDQPLHVNDDEINTEAELGIINVSESEGSDNEQEADLVQSNVSKDGITLEPLPGSSSTNVDTYQDDDKDSINLELSPPKTKPRYRPCTTDCSGQRPKHILPPRPKTALEKPISNHNRLKILNTLMDDEWTCSGSKLTSYGAVCGNLTRALRRPTPNTLQHISFEAEKELLEETLADASRALAAEIPRAPRFEDWEKFRKDTGIEINLDFNERPQGDSSKAIERLEQIEFETKHRLELEASESKVSLPNAFYSLSEISDAMWKNISDMAPVSSLDGDSDLPLHDIVSPLCSTEGSVISAANDDILP